MPGVPDVVGGSLIRQVAALPRRNAPLLASRTSHLRTADPQVGTMKAAAGMDNLTQNTKNMIKKALVENNNSCTRLFDARAEKKRQAQLEESRRQLEMGRERRARYAASYEGRVALESSKHKKAAKVEVVRITAEASKELAKLRSLNATAVEIADARIRASESRKQADARAADAMASAIEALSYLKKQGQEVETTTKKSVSRTSDNFSMTAQGPLLEQRAPEEDLQPGPIPIRFA